MRKSVLQNAVIKGLVGAEVLQSYALTLCDGDLSDFITLKKLEMEEAEKIRKHELTKLQLEHDLLMSRSSRFPALANPSTQFDVTKQSKLIPTFDEADPEDFFIHFEKVADVLQWPAQ